MHPTIVRFISTTISLLLIAIFVHAQEAPIYNPKADAKKDIAEAVKRAQAAHKNVFLQIGGNWCVWCLRFNKLVTGNDTLKTEMEKDFEVVHVNYSKENENKAVLASLDYPQRFGFPVFVILDGQGKRIHTQNSAYLEQGEGHSTKKILGFFKDWAPAALDAASYQ